jgi:hypothetical protein
MRTKESPNKRPKVFFEIVGEQFVKGLAGGLRRRGVPGRRRNTFASLDPSTITNVVLLKEGA